MCVIDGKMKVDKAVATTNDITINDLHNGNGIRYESILNALVEKKILAIKRDCEQTEQKLKKQRKQNCLGGLLFGMRRHQSEQHQHQQQQQCETITDNKSECSRIADPILINECAVVGNNATVNDDGSNAIVLVNRNRLIENENNHQQHGRHAVIEVNQTKPNEHGDGSEDCRSNSTIVSHSSVRIDDVGKSMSHLHSDVLRPARKISSDTIISIPSTSKHTTFSAPVPVTAICTIDQEQRRRLRVLEAKSISAQCSPIFPRQTFVGETVATLPPLVKFKSSIPQRLISRQNTSDDSVNVTFSSVLVNEDALDSGDTVSDNVSMGKKLQQRKKDSNKLGRCSVANDAHGFISNFNQLTSSHNLPPVISTTKLRSGGNELMRGSRLQSMAVVDAARTTNVTLSNESGCIPKTTVSGRSSDEEEPIKNDKRKNRKCRRT